MDAFFIHPWLFPVLVSVFGLIIGSFLNVVIYRLPQIMTFSWKQEFASAFPDYNIPLDQTSIGLSLPLSFCPHCHHPIRPLHNIPVLSWIFLRGKCAYCQDKISIQYPLVELLTACTSCIIAIHSGLNLYTLALLFFTFMIITSAMIDMNSMLLPDSLTLPLMWGGIALALLDIAPLSLQASIIGAMAGYLSLWAVYWIFKLLTKKEGMGYGDFKLFAALGAWMGWQILPIVIFIASVIGIIFGVVFLVFNKQKEDRSFPFGPSLAISGWICLLWGENILSWYSLFIIGG